MCQLFETIKVENKQLLHIAYHNARLNQARKEHYGMENNMDLKDIIQIPENVTNEIYKCRVTYNQEIINIEFEKHMPRKVGTLKVIHCNTIDYHLKYVNREHLKELFERRGNCDDILIIKKGLVTDTSFSNVIFWDGDKWITPSTPLLEGTARDRLLKSGRISARLITQNELKSFSEARIINALTDFNDKQNVKLVF